MSWLKLAIAVVLGLAVTTGGVAYAANASNPGDILYGLDLAMEKIQLNLTPDIADKVQLHLEFAKERLIEAQETISKDDSTHGQEALNAYGSEISAAAQLVGSAGSAAGADQDALLSLLDTAQGAHQAALTGLLDTVPAQAKDGIQKALDASSTDHPESVLDNPDNAGAPETDISTCPTSISQEDAQALADLAKQQGVDYQYVLQNFCALGTLDNVRAMLTGPEAVPTGVPSGPPDNASGKP